MLRDAHDDARAVGSFPLDDPHVVDQLSEALLDRVPDATRRFLLDTSVLDRMTPSLCDHVTGTPGSYATLEGLVRASMFVTRLPGDGQWYRSHGLFRAVLRHRLRAEDRRRERALTYRAARWHLARGDAALAVEHLAHARAWGELLRVVSADAGALLLENRPSEVTRRLQLVPLRVRARTPQVVLLHAAAAIAAGDPRAAATWLDRVGAMVAGPGESVVADLLRATLLVHSGDPRAGLRAAGCVLRGLDSVEEETLPSVFGLTSTRIDVAVAARLCRGVALCLLGRLPESAVVLQAAHLDAVRRGHVGAQLVGQGWLALARAWEGRLGDASALAARALLLSRELELADGPVVTPARVALAVVARERADLERASAWLADAARHADAARRPVDEAIVTTEQALVAAARRAPAEGLALLEAQRPALSLQRTPGLHSRRLAAEAHLLVLAGELDRADAMLERAPAATEVASARIRVALERGDRARARALMATWPDDGSQRSRVVGTCWRAVLTDVDRGESGSLRDVLVDAEVDRWIGVFDDFGRFALRPLRAWERVGPTSFLRAVLDHSSAAPSARSSPDLIEQLTERERFVLALLPTRASNAQLAQRLEMSINTLKTHLKHIYRKLGVEGRADAVAAAERTGLL
jgi:LuxR family maltose regulon positive regulatory protein